MGVVIPAGLTIDEAARWLGGSCWAELAVHEVLTAVMAHAEIEPDVRVSLWRVRAHRAESADEWHARLPELREMPRSNFVTAPSGWEMAAPTEGTALTAGEDSVAEVVRLLRWLEDRYVAHEAVAVGPADGPTGTSLRWVRDLLAQDLAMLAVPQR